MHEQEYNTHTHSFFCCWAACVENSMYEPNFFMRPKVGASNNPSRKSEKKWHLKWVICRRTLPIKQLTVADRQIKWNWNWNETTQKIKFYTILYAFALCVSVDIWAKLATEIESKKDNWWLIHSKCVFSLHFWIYPSHTRAPYFGLFFQWFDGIFC